MTRLYLIRHAEASGNIEKKFHGHFDSEITKHGHSQLELLKNRFKEIDIDICYSSDLQRAKKTALAVVGNRNIPIFEEKDLREINGGDVEDLYWEEIIDKHNDVFEMFKCKPHLISLPNGETIVELQNRIKNKILDIVGKNKVENICVTSHGMAIKTFLCYVKNIDLCHMDSLKWCDNTAVSLMEFKDNKINLILENDNSHLNRMEANITDSNWWKKG